MALLEARLCIRNAAVWAALQSFVPARCERSAMAYLPMSITPAGMHPAARVGAHTRTHARARAHRRSAIESPSLGRPLTRAISSTIGIAAASPQHLSRLNLV